MERRAVFVDGEVEEQSTADEADEEEEIDASLHSSMELRLSSLVKQKKRRIRELRDIIIIIYYVWQFRGTQKKQERDSKREPERHTHRQIDRPRDVGRQR